MKSTKFWVILLGAVLAVSLAASLLVFRGRGGACACIYQNGQLMRTVDLSQVSEPFTFTVEGPAGTNTVQVEPGRIRVSAADCPDQVCVHQGWISTGVVPIVCLPNRLVIQIEDSPPDSNLDGVTQ